MGSIPGPAHFSHKSKLLLSALTQAEHQIIALAALLWKIYIVAQTDSTRADRSPLRTTSKTISSRSSRAKRTASCMTRKRLSSRTRLTPLMQSWHPTTASMSQETQLALLLIPSPHSRESIILAVHSACPHEPLIRHRPCLACLSTRRLRTPYFLIPSGREWYM